MSRYQSSTSRLTLTDAGHAQWQQAMSLCSSAALTSLAAQLVAPALAAGQAAPPMLAAARLVTDPRLAELALAAGPDARVRLGEVRALLPAGPAALTTGATSNRLATDEPRAEFPDAAAELFTTLVPALARQERSVVADSAVDALGSLGYAVVHESGPGADGIEARRGHELMLLAVTDGGEISIGHLGADGACGDHQARFEAAMADRGVIMTDHVVDLHDDQADPLVSAATAAGEASLALAVARHTVAGRPGPGRARSTRAGTGRHRTQRRVRAVQPEEAR